MKNPTKAVSFPLITIKQAISVCWTQQLVPVIWGSVGMTKSASVRSLAEDLGLPIHDVRLSDKEPSDLGGIPFPVDTPKGKSLGYLMTGLLPFADIYGENYECILFFDEIDRTSMDVLNAALQLLLDRTINGKALSSKTHIVCAGNGITDTGTTELTSAAATRLCHFFVDSTGPKAFDHWVDWASTNGEDPSLIGFSRFRPELFAGPKHEYLEIQQPNPRTFTWAARTLKALAGLPFSPEVGDAIVFGLVGQVAGREFIAYRRIMADCPTLDQVVKDPDKAKLPPKDQVGVVYALGAAFLRFLYDPEAAASGDNPEANVKHTQAVAAYFQRIVEAQPESRESVVWFFRIAGAKLPSMAGLPEYQALAA